RCRTQSKCRQPKMRVSTDTSRPASWRKKCSTSGATACGWAEDNGVGSLPHVVALEGTDLDRAAPLKDRAALGEFGGGIEGVSLDNGKAADDFLDFDERPVRNDLFGVDDASFPLQPVAGVEHPTLAEALGDPGLPFLKHLLHFFRRHRAVGLAAVAVAKEKFG